MLAELRPRAGAALVGAFALGTVGLGGVIGVAMGLDKGYGPGLAMGMTSGLSILGLGPASLLLMGAGLLDRRPAPRGLWWLAASAVALAAGLVLGISVAADKGDAAMLLSGLCVAIPPTGLFGLLGGLSLARGLAEIRAGRGPAAVEAAAALLRAEGVATFTALQARCGVEAARLPETLRVAEVGLGEAIRVDVQDGYALRASVEAEGLRRLPGVVVAAGRLTLDALGRELRAPPPVVRRWLQETAGAGRLQGAIDWGAGVVVARASGSALQDGAPCDLCGGRLTLAGKDLLRCPHCGAQVMR